MKIRGSKQIKPDTINNDQVTHDSLTIGIKTYSGVTASGLGVKLNVVKEYPVLGTADGTNATFVLWNNPEDFSLAVYRNGMLQNQFDEYNVTGRSVIFTSAPSSGDKVAATYGIASFNSWNMFPINTARPVEPMTIDAYGYARAWGYGTTGTGSGDGFFVSRSSPVSVLGNRRFTQVVSQLVNFSNVRINYGIDTNGQVWSWGWTYGTSVNNPTFAMGGHNANTNVSSPVSIARPGSYSSVGFGWAIEGSTGQVFVWGGPDQSVGAGTRTTFVGDNTTTDRSSPVSLARPGSYREVVRIDLMNGYSIDNAGYVWSWGYNEQGQLGNNTITAESSPISVMIGPVQKVLISTGAFGGTFPPRTTVFLDNAGLVWGLGSGANGKIGDGSTDNHSSPVSIARGGSYFQIAACTRAIAAIDGATGYIWCWGDNSYGTLGNGTVTAASSPVVVQGNRSYRKVVGVSGAYNTSAYPGTFMALDSNGMVYCWGYNSNGNCGTGDTAHKSSPTAIARPGSYRDIFMFGLNEGDIKCYAIEGNDVWAWGYNVNGSLGDNTTANRSSPVAVRRLFY